MSDLDPKDTARDSEDVPMDRAPGTVATPEGDNEFGPDEPLTPVADGMQKTPAIDTNRL